MPESAAQDLDCFPPKPETVRIPCLQHSGMIGEIIARQATTMGSLRSQLRSPTAHNNKTRKTKKLRALGIGQTSRTDGQTSNVHNNARTTEWNAVIPQCTFHAVRLFPYSISNVGKVLGVSGLILSLHDSCC